MKMKKIVSAVLALSMAASIAGCSKVKKITIDDFVDACEAMGAEEVDYDEFEDLDDDAIEDGVYTIMDSDDIADAYEQYENNNTADMYNIDVPEPIIDAEDIEQAAVYVQMTQNTDDISGIEDIDDLDVDMILAAQMTLTDANMAEDYINGIADCLDEYTGIDVEDLSADEYYLGKNEGYLKVHVTVEDVVAAFYDSNIYGILQSFGSEMGDLEEVLDALSGDIAVATYVNGENVVLVMGVSIGHEPQLLDDFCSELTIDNPVTVDANPDVASGIMDYVDDTFGSMLSGFMAMGASF